MKKYLALLLMMALAAAPVALAEDAATPLPCGATFEMDGPALVEAIGGVYFDVPYNMDYHDQYQDLVIEQEKGYRKLNGDDAKGRVISRSVAQDRSHQVFHPVMVGNAKCFGHVQCDSIIMGEAKIESIPAITANSTEAQLIHEAAIGKIAGDQLLKLETLGLTEEEAEDTILKGFLA